MATLAEIRAKYPQYSDLTDSQLADGLHAKFYADMPRADFNARIGFAPPAPAAPVSTGDGPGIPYTEQKLAPQTPPTTGERAMRGLNLGVQDVGRGIAELFGAPVDLAAAGLNLAGSGVNALTGAGIPPITHPVGGSQSIKDAASMAADAVGVPMTEMADRTKPERVLGDAVRLTTQALGFGMPTAARGLAGAAAGATPGPLTAPYVDAARNAATVRAQGGPLAAVRAEKEAVRPFATDAAAGTGAALGAEGARQYGPDPATDPVKAIIAQTVAETLAGLGGASAMHVATRPSAILDSVLSLRTDPTTGTSRRIADEAARVTRGELTGDAETAATNIRQGAAEARDAGMTPPDSYLLSNDEGLFGTRRALANSSVKAEGTPTASAQFTERNRKAANDAGEVLSELNPGPDANARASTDFAQQQTDAKRAQAQSGVAAAEGQQQTATAAVEQQGAKLAAERGTGTAASEAVDKQVTGALDQRTAAKNEKFSAIDPDGEVQRDITPMAAAAEEVRAKVGKLNNPSEILPEDTLRRIDALVAKEKTVDTGVLDADGRPISRVETEGDGTVSFQDLNKLRPQLAAAETKARKAGDYPLASNIGRLKAEVNAEVERLAVEGGAAGVAAKDALDYYKTEFAPYFAQGAGGDFRKAVQRDDLARSATPPSATADRFLRAGRGSKETAADLAKIMEIAPDPAAGKAAVRQYLLDSASRTVENGKISVPRLREWNAQYADVLNSFPEAKAEFQGLLKDAVNGRLAESKAADGVKAAAAAAKRTEQEIQGSALSLFAGKEPRKAVEALFAAGDPPKAMAELVGRMKGDKAATAGLKKAVAEHLDRTVLQKNADETPSLAKITDTFRRNEDTLKALYSPDEMNKLRAVQKQMEVLARQGIQSGTGSPTSQNYGDLMRLAEIGLKVKFGVLAGGGMMRNLRLAAQTYPFLNDNLKIAQLLQRAAFEPELAAHLLERPALQIERSRWNTRLIGLLGVSDAARSNVNQGAE